MTTQPQPETVHVLGEEFMPPPIRQRETVRPHFRLAVDAAAQTLAEHIPQTEIDSLCVIMRAGLGMLPAFTTIHPHMPVGFIYISSPNEKDKPATLHTAKLSAEMHGGTALLLEPIVAYGKSAFAAIEALQKQAIRPKLASIIISNLAKRRLDEAGIESWTIAVDTMDEAGWLVPGAGDVGDRLWGRQ